jgi:hypothetical protein
MEDGLRRLEQIINAPPLYPKPFQWLLISLAGAGCCGIFFGGNWYDILTSFLFGLVVALMEELNKNPRFTRIYEVSRNLSDENQIAHEFLVDECFFGIDSSSYRSSFHRTLMLQGSNTIICHLATTR